MPYIDPYIRQTLDPSIRKLVEAINIDAGTPALDGVLNYVISTLMNHYYGGSTNYYRLNRGMGVLESAKLEFYRRTVSPYEDEKIKENGDLNFELGVKGSGRGF